MQAKENYDPTRATEADGAGFPTTTFVDTHLLGYSYDATHRELVYSAVINRQAGATTLTNNTGHTLWDGLTAVADGSGAFPTATGTAVNTNWNYYLARKSLDTGTVTFYDAYNAANTVPNGVGGSDGTWRRYVSDTAQEDQYPILTDPRTGDAWVHQESCELWYFQRSTSYAAIISPLRPTGNTLNPVLPIGMNTDWVFASEFTHVLPATTANLYLIPRQLTADEISADYILAYGTFAFPQTNPYCEAVVDNAGDLYVMMWNADGAPSSFTLYKFTQPSSIPYPSPPVGGGFTDITPWTSSTGPNHDTSGAVFAGMAGGRVRMFWNPGRTVLNILTVSDTGSSFGHIDHTWYNVATGDWATTTLADSWMTSGFVPTDVQADVAFNITGRMNPTNSYLDKDNFYAAGDYASRWVFFEACPIDAGGAPVTTQLRHVLVNLTWNDNAAPTITQVIDEQNAWDPAYTAYATAIGHTEVVRQSIDERAQTFVSPGYDAGVYDPTTNAFWWSGMSSETGIGDNMFQLDPAFTGRIANSAQPPLLRLSIVGSGFTQGHIF